PTALTGAASALMSAPAKSGRMPCLPGSMFVIAAPCSPPICVVWYSNGPGLAWNCHPNKEPQNCWLLLVSSAGISMWTISPGIAASPVSPCTAMPPSVVPRPAAGSSWAAARTPGYPAIFAHVIGDDGRGPRRAALIRVRASKLCTPIPRTNRGQKDQEGLTALDDQAFDLDFLVGGRDLNPRPLGYEQRRHGSIQSGSPRY